MCRQAAGSQHVQQRSAPQLAKTHSHSGLRRAGHSMGCSGLDWLRPYAFLILRRRSPHPRPPTAAPTNRSPKRHIHT